MLIDNSADKLCIYLSAYTILTIASNQLNSNIMSSEKYVIDGYYDFDITADGARPSCAGSSGLHLQFTHDKVMEMGEYFHEENPYEIDYDINFGIKSRLEEILLESIVAELEEEWELEYENSEDEDVETEEKPDFEEWAYERMGDMYFTWDYKFKEDCIEYYLAHTEQL